VRQIQMKPLRRGVAEWASHRIVVLDDGKCAGG
jgi:hypothetical protein